MSTPAHAHLRDSLDESALLADYLNPSLSLLDLSERHQLSIPDLVAWSERPAIAGLLIRLKALADQRAALLAADHAPAAVISLSAASASALTTAAEAETPALRLRAIESARKAASLMLRLVPRVPRHSDPKQESSPEADAPCEVDAPGGQAQSPTVPESLATPFRALRPESEPPLDIQSLIGAPGAPLLACAGPSP